MRSVRTLQKTSIATAKTVRTFLIAETIAITAYSFFLLPSSFFLLPSAITQLLIAPYLKLRQTAQIASIDPMADLNLIKSSKTDTHRL